MSQSLMGETCWTIVYSTEGARLTGWQGGGGGGDQWGGGGEGLWDRRHRPGLSVLLNKPGLIKDGEWKYM